MLNQQELIARIRVSLNYKYSQQDVNDIIKALTLAVLDATANGEECSLLGLGKFYSRFIKGKQIKKTGIPWLQNREFTIPDRYHLGFAPSSTANKKVNTISEKIKQYGSNNK